MLIPGLAAGVAGAFAVGKLLENQSSGVHPSPVPTIAAALVATSRLSLLATGRPARSAVRDDLRVRRQSDV